MIRLVRWISIAQAPTPAAPLKQLTLEAVSGVRQLVALPELEFAKFEPLGSPATVCSINNPPSVPLYVKRGGLLGIYGESTGNVRLRMFWKPLGLVWRSPYQRLVSTTPFSVLVSPPKLNQLFATVIVDGQVDWAIVQSQLFAIFTGNTLTLSVKPKPDGLANPGWQHRGVYDYVGGRGQLGLTGFGTVYRVNIADQETMMVSKKHLIALTTSGPEDLASSVRKFNVSEDHVAGTVATTVATVTTELPRTGLSAYIPKLPPTPEWITKVWHWVSGSTQKAADHADTWLLGTQDFVEITGPRTLLLQSGDSAVKSLLTLPKLDFTRGTKENPIPTPPVIQKQPADLFNVVTITPNGMPKVELKTPVQAVQEAAAAEAAMKK